MKKRLPFNIQLRDWSLSRLVREPTRPSGLQDRKAGDATMADPGLVDTKTGGATQDLVPGYSGYVPDENENPLKQRIYPAPKRKPIGKAIEWLKAHSPLRPPTVEELKLKEDKSQRKAIEGLLRQEARLYQQRIVNALERRGLCYRYRKSERDLFVSGIKRVKFDTVVLQPDAVYFRVDTLNIPRGVAILDLVDETILTDLSLACGRRVTAEWSEKIGCWYIVERASGVRGIPAQVSFQDMIERMPATADPLTIPMGMSVNSKPVFRSIEAMPHLLVAGATGTGKSNMVNVIIGTLITRNTPAELRLVMIDLKGGMEFTFFEGLPHLMPLEGITKTGIAYEREQVPWVLQAIIDEAERRMLRLKKSGHKNIRQYNAHRKHGRLPRILVVIDEWADVRLVPSIGRDAEDKLTNIASRGRAVGVHVILATQSPKKEVISTLVKTNLPGKMAFSMPSYTSSMLILDNGEAKGLEPAGRYIYQQGADQLPIQAPYMPNQIIMDLVAQAKGEKPASIAMLDLTGEVLEYAVKHLDCRLSNRELAKAFRGKLGQKALTALLSGLDGKTYQVAGGRYKVDQGNGGHIGRRLVKQNVATCNMQHISLYDGYDDVSRLSPDWRPKTKPEYQRQ